MEENQRHRRNGLDHPVDISDEDILEAMKDIQGYLDITPGDFKEMYHRAYHHALERFMHGIKARDIMTKNVISVGRGMPSQKVAEVMARHRISGVPVIDESDAVMGIISEKDFLFRMGPPGTDSFMTVIAQCLRSKGCLALPIIKKKAEDIMSSPAITVREETSISEITKTLTDKNINRVPVVDQSGKLVGIISRGDIIPVLLSLETK
jgi:CBS domain-containing protein